jgi:hypothetical protein
MRKGTGVNRMRNIHRARNIKNLTAANNRLQQNPVKAQNSIILTKKLPLETYYVYLLG